MSKSNLRKMKETNTIVNKLVNDSTAIVLVSSFIRNDIDRDLLAKEFKSLAEDYSFLEASINNFLQNLEKELQPHLEEKLKNSDYNNDILIWGYALKNELEEAKHLLKTKIDILERLIDDIKVMNVPLNALSYNYDIDNVVEHLMIGQRQINFR